MLIKSIIINKVNYNNPYMYVCMYMCIVNSVDHIFIVYDKS